jgi:hypothetical protein
VDLAYDLATLPRLLHGRTALADSGRQGMIEPATTADAVLEEEP